LLHKIRSEGRTVLPVASTGIAANLLKGGRTYHSEFKIPLKLNETSVSGIKPRSKDSDRLRNSQLVIWDESTMAPALALDCVDRLAQEILSNETAFGGKTFLLGGDFRQTLPVIPGADSATVVQASLKYSKVWHEFHQLKLYTNVRSEDPDYSEWLIMLGNGDLTNEVGLEADIIEIPSHMVTNKSIVTEVYGSSIKPSDVKKFYYTAILCPKNDDADDINSQVLNILCGEAKTYLSTDSLVSEDNDDVTDFPSEFLNSLTPSGTSPHELRLKIGTIIMLLRNLNTDGGRCKGTRFVVNELREHIIEATAITGTAAGSLVFIPRIDLITDSGLPFQLKRRQFPVKVAFAMTINKSQGQTLDRIGLYLPNPVFSHGQLYVAFSRVRRSADVKVFVKDTHDQGKLLPGSNRVFTRNVVYKSII
jgi:ATP-dependent DNA helicase PIF1